MMSLDCEQEGNSSALKILDLIRKEKKNIVNETRKNNERIIVLQY